MVKGMHTNLKKVVRQLFYEFGASKNRHGLIFRLDKRWSITGPVYGLCARQFTLASTSFSVSVPTCDFKTGLWYMLLCMHGAKLRYNAPN